MKMRYKGYREASERREAEAGAVPRLQRTRPRLPGRWKRCWTGPIRRLRFFCTNNLTMRSHAAGAE
jgi:hypothetical protein